VSVARIRDLYPHFEYSQLVQHPAIVLIPYQVRRAHPLLTYLPCRAWEGRAFDPLT
jgi:hypothetical protein